MKVKNLLMLVACSIMLWSYTPTIAFAGDSASAKKDSVVLKNADSTTTTVSSNQITAPSDITIFGIKLPAWVGMIALSLLVLLPAIQLILKNIPGAAPISGVLGAILNILTFWQKNNSPPAKSGSS